MNTSLLTDNMQQIEFVTEMISKVNRIIASTTKLHSLTTFINFTNPIRLGAQHKTFGF